MRFLVDAQLPPHWPRGCAGKVMKPLPSATSACAMPTMRRSASRAIAEQSIVVTKDEDFASMAAIGGEARVLWVRTGNLVNRPAARPVWSSLA